MWPTVGKVFALAVSQLVTATICCLLPTACCLARAVSPAGRATTSWLTAKLARPRKSSVFCGAG